MSTPDSQKKFPLQARIALVIFGCVFFTLGIMMVAQSERPSFTADGIASMLGLTLGLLVVVALGSASLWLGICYRELSLAELESLDRSPLPPLSDDAIVSRFSMLGTGVRRVVVDIDQRRVQFRGCHTPRKFLAVAEAEYSCSFDDLVDVHRCQNKGDSLTIVTRAGKAHIPSTATNYESLCDRLPGFLPKERPVIDVDNPLIGILYVFAALVGLFGGLALAPQATSALWTGLLMAVGAALGIVLSHAIVVFINAKTQRSIVPALVGGLLGAAFGWILTSSLLHDPEWSGRGVVIGVIVCTVAGFVLGMMNGKKVLQAPIDELRSS